MGMVQHLKVADKAYSGLDFWAPDAPEYLRKGGNADIHVPKENTEEFEEMLEYFEIDYKIMTNNVQHDIDMERLSLNRNTVWKYVDFENIGVLFGQNFSFWTNCQFLKKI